GLTRAYGQAAQAVMEGLKTEQEVPKTEIQVTCDFSQEQPLRHWLSLVKGELVQVDYQQQVQMRVQLPDEKVSDFTATLEASRCDYKVLKAD
ncbi:MAG: DUF1949 domain-containing protein, partial [Pseudomonadota bacterium]|nr:DUF1949 domain-containing protein [Pseudomonadota bacterium]